MKMMNSIIIEAKVEFKSSTGLILLVNQDVEVYAVCSYFLNKINKGDTVRVVGKLATDLNKNVIIQAEYLEIKKNNSNSLKI